MVIDSAHLQMRSMEDYRPICPFEEEEYAPPAQIWNNQKGRNETIDGSTYKRVRILVARDEAAALGVLNAQLAVHSANAAKMDSDLREKVGRRAEAQVAAECFALVGGARARARAAMPRPLTR
jgi:hypothetical protein